MRVMKKLVLLVCGVVLLTASCGLFRKKPKIVLPNTGIRLAGRVERVESTANYVLIRRYGPWRFDPETDIVESRGGTSTANLLPTGEKLGEHIAADIRSGQVEVGDAVYIRRIKASQNPKPSTEPEKPAPVKNQVKTPVNP